MKKILLYTESMRRGGAERVMSIIANSFFNKGYDVVLVTELTVNDSNNDYEILKGIKHIHLNVKKGNFLIKNIQKVKKLRAIIKNEKPDVVLSFLGNQNIRMMISAHNLKCKKYLSIRNDPNKEYSSFIKKLLAKKLFKRADGIVFQTKDAMSFFGKKVQKKSIIIANPIDEKFFNINQISNPQNIIAVGRLEKQKNYKLLIDAYKNLHNSEDKLLIFGEGSLKNELNDYIVENKLEGKVILMGGSNIIEEELSKAKIFVLSSDYEGMPNCLMEAMAVGLPCLSTDCPCGGPRLLIRDESEGFLVPCNDSKKMSETIKKVLDLNYKTIGKNAKNRANDFRKDKIIEQWEKYLFK